MIIKILVLCQGNITRSPFIAGYLHSLYRKSGLADKIRIDIDSGGIEGKVNMLVHPEVLEKGHELGFDLDMYRSKHSDYQAFEDADLIFVVKKRQYSRFENNFPNLIHKVYHLYSFGRSEGIDLIDFEDPSHEKNENSFDEFFDLIQREVERIWKYMEDTIELAIAEGRPVKSDLFHKPIDKSVSILKGYNIITKRFKPLCPKCQSRRIRRIKRKSYFQKKIFPKLNGYPYHCGACDKNFILFIGAEVYSQHKKDKKSELWQKFIETEKAAKEQEDSL